MVRLLERSIRSVHERLVLLAPPGADIPTDFKNVLPPSTEHHGRLRELQRLRGTVYRDDGALAPADLRAGGIHATPEDSRSWHLVMLNKQRQVSSCVWYMEHENTASWDQLRVRSSPPALRAESSHTVRKAVNTELATARRAQLRFAELGGWAVCPENRCSTKGLTLALAAYSLGRLFGGALGLTTATVRHSSAGILRRLGGTGLQSDGAVVGPYYDPRYNCNMELLRFDSRRPSPRYEGLIDILRDRLALAEVLPFELALPAVA